MAHVLMLLVCLLAGATLRGSGRLPEGGHTALNAVVINVGLPALTLAQLGDLHWSRDMLLPLRQAARRALRVLASCPPFLALLATAALLPFGLPLLLSELVRSLGRSSCPSRCCRSAPSFAWSVPPMSPGRSLLGWRSN